MLLVEWLKNLRNRRSGSRGKSRSRRRANRPQIVSAIESLENRTLMSATNPSPESPEENILSNDTKQAIRDGLDALVQTLEQTSEAGEGAVGALLSETFSKGLVTDVKSYLANANSTIEGLKDTLRNLSQVVDAGAITVAIDPESVTVEASAQQIRISLRVQATRIDSVSLSELTQGVIQEQTAGEGSVPANQLQAVSEIDFQLAFGVDLAVATSDPAERFFVELSPNVASLETRIEATNLDLPINISFLGANVDGGTVTLNSRATLGVSHPSGSQRFTLGELRSAEWTGDLSGSYAVSLPVRVEIGSYTRETVITVANQDLSLSELPTIDFGSLGTFGSLDRDTVLEALKLLKSKLSNLAQNAVLNAELPFAQGVKISDAIRFGEAFADQVLNRLAIPDANGKLTPTFANAQEFAEQLAVALGVGPSTYLGNIYNPETRELTFQIDFEKVFTQDVSLGFADDVAGVADFQVGSAAHPNPKLHLTANASGGFAFVVNLAAQAALPFSVRNASFQATLAASAQNVNGSARIGGFGIDLVNGSANVNLSVAANAGASTNLNAWNLTPQISGSASATLPVQFAAGIDGVALPQGTRVDFQWPDVTNPSSLSADLTSNAPFELETLVESLESVALSHVVQGLEHLVEFLRDVQSQGVFQEDIPIVGQSLSELLDLSEKLDALADELKTNPPVTIHEALDRINRLLDSAASVAFNPIDRVLEFDLNYDFEKTKQVDLAFNLDDSLNAGLLEDFVNVTASAPLTLKLGGTANLGLVIELRQASGPLFGIKDTSQVQVTALIQAEDIDLEASIGPLGIYVENGSVHLDNGTIGQAATVTVNIGNQTGQNYGLGSALSAVTIEAKGRLEANLPVAFPTRDNDLGPITLAVGDLARIASTTTLTQPNFAEIAQSFDLTDSLDLIVEGLDYLLGKIQNALDGRDLPLIGKKLSDVTSFLRDIRSEIVTKLESLDVITTEGIQRALYNAFGPQGLNILAERLDDLNQALDVGDVKVDLATNAGLLEEITFDFALADDFTVSQPINLDLGLDGLGLEVDADLNITVDYKIDLGFGISRNEGFFIRTGKSASEPEIQIAVDATLSDRDFNDPAQVSAELFFLKLSAKDRQVSRNDRSTSGSYFAGQFAIDLLDPNQDDNRLTFSELVSSVTEAVDVDLSATAHVALGLEAGVGSSASFPRLAADFELLWQFDTADPNLDGSIQKLAFNNVRINLNDFITKTIEPVLANINSVLDPIVPIAKRLTDNIPLLASIFGKESFSLIDLAKEVADLGLFGGSGRFGETTEDFLRIVGNLGSLTQRIEELRSVIGTASDGYLRIGNLKLDAQAALDAANLGRLKPAIGSTNSAILGAQAQQKAQGLEEETGFTLPVLANPSQLFGLLLGQDVDLVRFDLPKLDFNFGFEQTIGAPIGLQFNFGGEIGAEADLAFGFSTAGLRQFAEGGFRSPELILNGLYISDTSDGKATGVDVPEFKVYGSLFGEGSLDLFIASGSVRATIAATFEANLDDPNNDGRVYLQELIGGFKSSGITGLFDFEGNVDLKVTATGRFLVFKKTKTLAEVELFQFQTNPDPAPTLGQVHNGTLTLTLTDNADDLVITAGETAGDVVVTSYAGGTTVSESFAGVNHIVGYAGGGNDVIRVDRAVKATLDLNGGSGMDTLQAGGGRAVLRGGTEGDTLIATIAAADLYGDGGMDMLRGGLGNDTLYGGSEGDFLYGGEGNDTIDGNTGNDEVHGEGGNDTLHGGIDQDTLYGGYGDDTLTAGSGNDTLYGGDGNDTLYGTSGTNILHGEDGDDTLQGGVNNDTLDGGRGDDELHGHEGIDELFGGLGRDLLFGGLDGDTLYGGFGSDTLYGDGGVDHLYGESGEDNLNGGADGDYLFGGDGDDAIFGFDSIFINGMFQSDNDSTDGDDELYGEAGNDQLYGGQGNDRLEGGAGSDLIHGEAGNDRIVYAVDLNDPTGIDDLSGGTEADIIEIQGTGQADDLRFSQPDRSESRFIVERRDVGSDPVTATFEFTLPPNVTDRDIELLQVSGLGGDDVIRAIGNFNVNRVRIDGGDGHDVLTGSDGEDLIFGGEGNDLVQGGMGEDELQGGGGDDTLRGGDGTDAIFGMGGNDRLYGEAGFDIVFGGLGEDYLEAGDDMLGDILYGDTESESIGQKDTIRGSAGIDFIFGGGGDDNIDGSGLGDVIHGGDGNDTIIGGGGRDYLDGGMGGDTLYANTTDASVESVPSSINYLEILDELDVRRDALRAELRSLDDPDDPSDPNDFVGRIPRLQQEIADLTANDPNHPDLPGLQNELAALVEQRTMISNSITIINLTEIDLLPYQTIQTDVVLGQSGNDTLYGSSNVDRLIGGSGSDVIVHSAGNDIVFGGTDDIANTTMTDDSSSDEYRVLGTQGNDVIAFQLIETGGNPKVFVTINGRAGSAVLASRLSIEKAGVQALAGDDQVSVQFGANATLEISADGGEGNDTLDATGFQAKVMFMGGAGNDTLIGGMSQDTLDGGAGNDILEGNAGIDTYRGGTGYDRLKERTNFSVAELSDTALLHKTSVFDTNPVTESATGIEAAEITSLASSARIDASAFSGYVTLDATAATASFSLFAGQAGSELRGGHTGGYLNGGVGADVIYGGNGNDSIYAGNGNDVIYAGNGSDTISGGLGSNTIHGGNDAGIDTLFEYSISTSLVGMNVTLSGSSLTQRVSSVVEGQTNFTGIEKASITTAAGNDTIDATAFQGETALNGGDGIDTIRGSNLAKDVVHGGNGDDWIYGNGGDDQLYGDYGTDRIYGNAGINQVYGGEGSDYLYASSGGSYLYGDGGADYLYGSEQLDYLYGGNGNDTIYAYGGNDYLYGGENDDYLNGGTGDDRIYGDNGNDELVGGGGLIDYLYGGNGNDILRASATSKNYLYGEDGNDTLYGSQYQDYLYGGVGGDHLYGYGGVDYLNGGYDDDPDYLYGGSENDNYVTYYIAPYGTVGFSIRVDSISDSGFASHISYAYTGPLS